MNAPHPGLVGGPIYLDYNATTPVDPRVVEAMLPYLASVFGNPSSNYHYADKPRVAIDSARAQVAILIGAEPETITFTGSGSEANNLAIRGAALASGKDRPHVITQQTEHPAVLATCHALERVYGVDVTYLPVDDTGLVDPKLLAAAFTPRTVLVTIMHANNETGVIQPITELAAITHEHGALFHTDAAQTVGKIPVNVAELDVDLLTIVGHKMYAPKGVGALHIRPGVPLEPVIYGGGQEYGLRAGTENIAHIVGLGAAADVANSELADGRRHRLQALRNRLHDHLTQRLPGAITVNGHPTLRLPHVLNISIKGIHGDEVLAATPGVAASTGSACHTGSTQPSPVLTAMGLGAEQGLSALRLSLGRWTTKNDVDRAAKLITAAVRPA